jgi:AraC-like DNA-binding protein
MPVTGPGHRITLPDRGRDLALAAAPRRRYGSPVGALLRSEFVGRRPHPLLRPHVLRYGGFAELVAAPLRRREVASSAVAVILALEGRWAMTDPARGGAWCSRQSFVGGLVGGPVLVEHDGYALTLQFDTTPLGARLLLGVPGVQLASQVVGLEDLLGADASALLDGLRSLPDWPARFAALDAFLLGRLAAAAPVSADVRFACARLAATGGAVRIGSLVEQLGCSRRHLSRRFGEEVGMTPKAYARVLRFERAWARLGAGERASDVAYACGYADQPHFNRDFIEFAGVTPTVALGERAALAA